MNPIRTIKDALMFGTDYRNLLVMDVAADYHIAVWKPKENTLTNFHTGELIVNPIAWDYLPKHDPDEFERTMKKVVEAHEKAQEAIYAEKAEELQGSTLTESERISCAICNGMDCGDNQEYCIRNQS